MTCLCTVWKWRGFLTVQESYPATEMRLLQVKKGFSRFK